MAKLDRIEGIGEAYQLKLNAVGINSTESLLDMGCSPEGRKALEEKTGIRHELILEWVNHADLFRIPGIGEEYSDLLEAAGVDTVKELAQRNPDRLYDMLIEKNTQKSLVRRVPSKAQVESWVEAAKNLPRVVTY